MNRTTTFEYIDRSSQKAMVLIPGWASDYRIFDSLDLDYDYLIPSGLVRAQNFAPLLLEAIKNNRLDKISLLGWSLGSFLAADFSIKFPELIDKLILVGVRKKYMVDRLREIKSLLIRGKQGYLSGFYRQCFYNQEARLKFKIGLMKDYLKELDLTFLLEGLDYLAQAKLDVTALKNLNHKIILVQGKEDNIAPLVEAERIKNDLPQAKFIPIEEAGHAVFLEKNITEYL